MHFLYLIDTMLVVRNAFLLYLFYVKDRSREAIEGTWDQGYRKPFAGG